MCGIGGILRVWQPGKAPQDTLQAIPEAWLYILDESIKHRGPDGQGRFRQRVTRPDGAVVDVALVHRRLSIIDHADGAQPMVVGEAGNGGAILSREGQPYAPLRAHRCPKCGDGMVAVAFNGCIYNHRELRRELEAAGHVFHTDHSDTEVLLHGWREWATRGSWMGDGLCGHLDGMYAVLIWSDAEAHLGLHGSRDPFGEKPLHRMSVEQNGSTVEAWCSSPNGLGLLSKSLGNIASEPRAVQARSVARWIRYGYGRRLMRGIGDEAPETGSVAGWELQRLQWRRPSEPPSEERALPPRMWTTLSEPVFRDAEPLTIERTERLLREAVCSRLETDVPLGCFLSGGIDSSLIAAMASRELPKLRTFCMRMSDARYDESANAALVAKHLDATHETVEIAPDPAADLIDLIHSLGLPFADSSLLPTSWLCRAVRERVRVALSGDGGDELFLGYQRYVGAEALKRWRPLLALLPLGTAGQRNPKSRLAMLSRLAGAARAKNQYDMHTLFDEPTLTALIGERGRRRQRQNIRTPVWGASAYRSWDLIDYLRDDLLRKTDTASMRYALEVRCPFLDHRLLTAALDTPVRTLMLKGRRKGLLREVARRHLPDHIVDRPKMGFAIPIGEWFRTDYGGMRQLLYDHLEAPDPFPGLAEAGVELNRDFIARMLLEHDAAGERSVNPWHGRDHSQRLYMLLVLSIWCRWLRSL